MIPISENNIQPLSEGWIVGKSIIVTPSDVNPDETIHIKAVFKNEAAYLPAYGTLQIRLDGIIIWTSLPYQWIQAGNQQEINIDYPLPSSIAIRSHTVEALEADQTKNIPVAYFTVTALPPTGQRNVAFSSIPTNAQIWVSEAYRGDTPLTISLTPGTYSMRAVYDGKAISRNVQVTTGVGSMEVKFTFDQTGSFDLVQWISDNKFTLIAAGVGVGLVYFAIKKPETVKKGYSIAKEYATKKYHAVRSSLK